MLGAFVSAFRAPDLRKKLLFTFAIMALFRLGSIVPAPGVDTRAIRGCLSSADSSGAFGLMQLISGGALLQLSVFALGIMPYITSSIIMQLLTVVIPRLERLREEGESGNQKITQYTRYVTIALAILQSTVIVSLARTDRLIPGCSGILPDTSVIRVGTIVVTMTAGTAMIMWLGELITDRGIGNGMSLLIFTSISSRLPAEGGRILASAGGFVFSVVLLLGLVIVVGVIAIEQSQRRIPVQYAKRMIGRRQYGGTQTYIPMKVNQAGVIPVIFASSLLYLPQLIGGVTSNPRVTRFIADYLTRGNHPIYMLIYTGLIIFFAYFYTAITFNTVEISDNMKKYGGFIPGIRPGRPTAEYLDYILNRITLPGALFLSAITVGPFFLLSLTRGNQFPFGGTAVLIMVGVGLETVKQIESQLMMRNYEGFLR
ncbi:MAG: preprotein translocase subunit SecY [Mycobacteriales bacterium]